ISASQQHAVPTALATKDGMLYVGNLSTFPIVPGASHVWQVTPDGQISTFASGLTTVVGLAFDAQGQLYAAELSVAPGEPAPAAGRIVKVNPSGTPQVVADGVMFPTALAFGPDGMLYVSTFGLGPPGA